MSWYDYPLAAHELMSYALATSSAIVEDLAEIWAGNSRILFIVNSRSGTATK
jgi:hypothetical protein